MKKSTPTYEQTIRTFAEWCLTHTPEDLVDSLPPESLVGLAFEVYSIKGWAEEFMPAAHKKRYDDDNDQPST